MIWCPKCHEEMSQAHDDDPLCRQCMIGIEVEKAESQFEARFRGSDTPVGYGANEFDAIDNLIRAI